MDNLSTGRAENVADLRESAAFDLMLHDVVVTLDVDGQVDYVFHLATYGPGMRCDDGRAVPEFTARALRGAPLLVTGTGLQTRSLCFVSDLVEGLLAMAAARGAVGPVNLGNPHEVTVLDLALTIRELCESESEVRLVPGRQDDPRRRCPDVALARELLSWSARVELRDGLAATVEAFRRSVPLTPSRGSTVGAR